MVDRAVIRLAERGEGYVEWVAPNHHLRAGFYDLILTIDTANKTLTVLRIYRTR